MTKECLNCGGVMSRNSDALCLECITILRRLNKKENERQRAKRWKRSHREQLTAYQRKWYSDKREYFNAYRRKRYKTNAAIRLSSNIACNVYQSLKGSKNGLHWETLVEWTLKQLMRHITKQLQPGMSWDNYGEWHIDHIIPVTAFSFSKYTDADFKRCWSLSNLQPLWARDNLSKQGKCSVFQPLLFQ